MQFAHPIPWWAVAMVVLAIAALAFFEYRRPLSPLSRVQRGVLIALRALALGAIFVYVFRPIVLLPPASARATAVPILIDGSRSMRLQDADGQARIARAAAVLRTQLLPSLSRQYKADLYSIGDQLAPTDVNHLTAEQRQTDLVGALAAVRERYRGQRIAGVIVLSDGGDTSGSAAAGPAAAGLPVFAIGIGSTEGVPDREVVGVTAGDPRLDQSSLDLQVSVVSSGFGRTPFQLRVLANGRVLESRRLVPAADGAPMDETFTVSPDLSAATVYTAEIPADETEAVRENNARTVLVSPAGRKRRLLMVEGAPGFEHSFMRRALAHDPGLEVDSVVRKGKNADGQDTFFVQSAAARTPALLAGFPSRREDLYVYDAVVVANVEADFFTRAQLGLMADFVAERGGGLLVLGGRSFAARGLIGTPLEEVLPVELSDRRGGGVLRTALDAWDAARDNTLTLTAEGETHPVMRVGASREETLERWAALPPLAASAALGGPRPGATVLAVTRAPGGRVLPVVAVQRYGQGRSMVFAGEASWRWKMMLASTDRTHEYFWRQAVRWLARPSPDPVVLTVPESSEPGDVVTVTVDARDAAYAPAVDAAVDLTLISESAEARSLKLRRSEGSGRFTTTARLDRPGLYRVTAEARRGSTPIGTAERFFYVGGTDREFADPRLNEGFLRRLARTSGGRYVRAADAARVVTWLAESVPQSAAPEQRDLWHTPWAFLFVVSLLASEWMLRRRWGLR